ncbi:hypothetical protein ACWEK5_24440 [Rhodococcus koreensis]
MLLHHAAEMEAAGERLASGIPTKTTISAPMTTITEMLSPFIAKNLTEWIRTLNSGQARPPHRSLRTARGRS